MPSPPRSAQSAQSDLNTGLPMMTLVPPAPATGVVVGVPVGVAMPIQAPAGAYLISNNDNVNKSHLNIALGLPWVCALVAMIAPIFTWSHKVGGISISASVGFFKTCVGTLCASGSPEGKGKWAAFSCFAFMVIHGANFIRQQRGFKRTCCLVACCLVQFLLVLSIFFTTLYKNDLDTIMATQDDDDNDRVYDPPEYEYASGFFFLIIGWLACCAAAVFVKKQRV